MFKAMVIDNSGSRLETARSVDLWWREHIEEKEPPVSALTSTPAGRPDAGPG